MIPVPSRRWAWRAALVMVLINTGVMVWNWWWLIEAGTLPSDVLGWGTALGLCLFGLGEKDPGFFGRAAGKYLALLRRVRRMSVDWACTPPIGLASEEEQEAFSEGYCHHAIEVIEIIDGKDQDHG